MRRARPKSPGQQAHRSQRRECWEDEMPTPTVPARSSLAVEKHRDQNQREERRVHVLFYFQVYRGGKLDRDFRPDRSLRQELKLKPWEKAACWLARGARVSRQKVMFSSLVPFYLGHHQKVLPELRVCLPDSNNLIRKIPYRDPRGLHLSGARSSQLTTQIRHHVH